MSLSMAFRKGGFFFIDPDKRGWGAAGNLDLDLMRKLAHTKV